MLPLTLLAGLALINPGSHLALPLGALAPPDSVPDALRLVYHAPRHRPSREFFVARADARVAEGPLGGGLELAVSGSRDAEQLARAGHRDLVAAQLLLDVFEVGLWSTVAGAPVLWVLVWTGVLPWLTALAAMWVPWLLITAIGVVSHILEVSGLRKVEAAVASYNRDLAAGRLSLPASLALPGT